MTEPTLESMNEAARAVGYKDWDDAHRNSFISTRNSIRAHALTLDELHGRKEVIEAAEFWASLYEAVGNSLFAHDIRSDHTRPFYRKAIALIEAKFAELRAPKEHEWAYCSADGCYKKGSPNADYGAGCRNRY
jgi:hypothetical protein